ncbi:MAG TPA: hypothetical protein VNZ22_09900 [Bacillota bacterium]|nr:hypothetical protein [Bacillota bacterium]
MVRIRLNRTKNLEGPCSHCGGSIEYAAELIGTTTQCPHCGQVTELQLATPPQEPTLPRRAVFWTLTAVVILLLGLGGSVIALKRAQHLAEQHKAKAHRPAKP